MKTLQELVRDALEPLVGLPLMDAMSAADMQCFGFGAYQPCVTSKGEETEATEYSLHLDCPWRIVGPNGIVVGSDDGYVVLDDDADGSSALSRRSALIASWLAQYSEAPLKVERIENDAFGGFRLFLENGFVFEVFPAHVFEDDEHWRLLPPEDRSHFVVTGSGVERAS